MLSIYTLNIFTLKRIFIYEIAIQKFLDPLEENEIFTY